ncbi:MAG: class I SAM-dependent RNA methyltransferase [Chloroflexi bacterium]|nr:class I SAM-dependent RNA methyltransferase [Chloroflexota bacterium]MDA1239219.1 class I SAM-dependent RNA methyltransferase [Chloroflexota bacterium]
MPQPLTLPIIPTAIVPEPVPNPRNRKDRRAHNRPLVPIELTLTGFAAGGKAVGHHPDGRVVFVEFALPGERVIAEITTDRADYLEATAVLVLEASEHRIAPPCQYFGRCGGCQLQHVDYEEQLRLKTGIVGDQLARIARFSPERVAEVLRPMLGMDNPWGYRNHVRFTVRRDGQIGFMQRGTHHFMRIDECAIALPRVNEVLRLAQDNTMQTQQLSVRVGEHTGDEILQPHLQWRPGKRAPKLASGQLRYVENLLGTPYRISGPAFFQVNTRQAEHLVSMVVERVQAARPHIVVDAYAGVGTFAAQLAPWVSQVITIEESAAAGVDAGHNLSEFDNVTRVVGKVEDVLPGMTPEPDVVVIDPPRTGLFPGVIEAIIVSAARRVVYVSCDPGTLARDLRLFEEGGFTVREVQPVDMFPHTQHIECVTTIDRTGPRPQA